jgi:hypothetical protein
MTRVLLHWFLVRQRLIPLPRRGAGGVGGVVFNAVLALRNLPAQRFLVARLHEQYDDLE